MKRAKVNRSHFQKIKKIGIGAFGEVSLVRSIKPYQTLNGNACNLLYAMKKLKKSRVVEENQVGLKFRC